MAPQFNHSTYSSGKAVGVFLKGQGGPSPIVEADNPADDNFKHPFQVWAYKSGNDFKARVRAGTVNNLVPTISSTLLDAATPPELTLTGNGTHRIYIKGEVGGSPVFFPDTVTIVSTTSTFTDSDSAGYLQIASITVTAGKITALSQFVYASQILIRAKPGEDNALWSWSSR